MNKLEKLNRLDCSFLLKIKGGEGDNTGKKCTKYTGASQQYPCGDVTVTISDDCGNSVSTTTANECFA